MAKDKNPKHRHPFSPRANPLHDAAFIRYKVGSPILIGTETAKIIAYYAGFDEKNLLIYSSIDTSKPGPDPDRPRSFADGILSREDVLYTHLLKVKNELEPTSLDFSLGLWNKYLDSHTMIEYLVESGLKGVGITLRKTDNHPEDLAHTLYLNGNSDFWFKPSYVPPERWLNPTEMFSLNGIKTIKVLEDTLWDWNFSLD